MTKLMMGKGIDILGAIDVNPNKVRKDLGKVAGLCHSINVKVSDDAVLSRLEAYCCF